MTLATMKLAAFNPKANVFDASNSDLSGLPYVTEPGLYRATIASATVETKTVRGEQYPAVVLQLRASHVYSEGHSGRMRLSVYVDSDGTGRAPFAYQWWELCFAAGAIVAERDANGGLTFVPKLESETVQLSTPTATGETSIEHVRSFEGKEIAVVVTRRPYNGRYYLNAKTFLRSEDLLQIHEWMRGETVAKHYLQFPLRGLGLALDYPASEGGNGGSQFASTFGAPQAQTAPQAPAYPSYPAYAGIPQAAGTFPPAQSAPAYEAWGQTQGAMPAPVPPQMAAVMTPFPAAPAAQSAPAVSAAAPAPAPEVVPAAAPAAQMAPAAPVAPAAAPAQRPTFLSPYAQPNGQATQAQPAAQAPAPAQAQATQPAAAPQAPAISDPNGDGDIPF